MKRRQLKVSGWHPEEIKAAIRMTGVSVEQLSLVHGYSASFLRAAFYRRLFEAEQIIARHISQKPNTLWPDRYDTQGRPLHRGRERRRKRRHPHLGAG